MNTNFQNHRQEYFDLSTRIGKCVDDYVRKFLKESETGREKEIIYAPILSKKYGKQKLRANIFGIAYIAMSHFSVEEVVNDERFVKIATAIEFLNWSTYMTNWIYDNKGNVSDITTKKKVVTSIGSLLTDAVTITMAVDQRCVASLLDSYNSITKSFVPEIENMHVTNTGLYSDEESYKRIYDLDYATAGVGVFFANIVDLAAYCTGYEDHTAKEKLRDSMKIFGRDTETLNCLGDFIIGEVTSERILDDQFSDMRNDTLTSPIWMMHNAASDEERGYILSNANKRLDLKEKIHLLKLLFDTGTYGAISKEIKHNSRVNQRVIREMPFSEEAKRLLHQMHSVLESNKIYHYLDENYAKYVLSQENNITL